MRPIAFLDPWSVIRPDFISDLEFSGALPAEAAYYRPQQCTRVLIVSTYCLLSVGRRSTMKSS